MRGSISLSENGLSVFVGHLCVLLRYAGLVFVKTDKEIGLSDGSYLVDPASSHMLVSKIKPCMS